MSQVCYSFKDTGSCKFGDSCRFSHGNGDDGNTQAEGTFETVRGRNTSSRGRNNAPGNSSNEYSRNAPRSYDSSRDTSSRPAQLCNQWNENGTCTFGDRCRFSHGEEYTRSVRPSGNTSGDTSRSQACYAYAENGTCQYGDRCRFTHGDEMTSGANRYNQSRKSTQVCYEYKESGSCKYGDRCRFSHSDDMQADENNNNDESETNNDSAAAKSPIATPAA